MPQIGDRVLAQASIQGQTVFWQLWGRISEINGTDVGVQIDCLSAPADMTIKRNQLRADSDKKGDYWHLDLWVSTSPT